MKLVLGILRRFGRFFARLALVVIVAFATFWVVTWFFPGDTFLNRLGESYQFLWSHTSRQQFTDIMREKPYLYFAPTVLITLIIGAWLPRSFRALLVAVMYSLGFVGGHVFW